MVIKRRTLFYSLMVIVVALAASYMVDKEIVHSDHGHFSIG